MTTQQQQRIADRLFKSDVILAIKKCAGRASEEYRDDVVNDVFLAIVSSKHPFEFFERMPDNEFKFYVIRIATNNATYEFKKSARLTSGEAFEVALKLNRDTTDEAEMMERELEFLQKMERYERWAALYPRLAIWAQNELEGRRAAAESNECTENSVKWVASKFREIMGFHINQIDIFDFISISDYVDNWNTKDEQLEQQREQLKAKYQQQPRQQNQEVNIKQLTLDL